jgi:hypothetical protein
MDFFGRGIVNLRKETFITFDKIANSKIHFQGPLYTVF